MTTDAVLPQGRFEPKVTDAAAGMNADLSSRPSIKPVLTVFCNDTIDVCHRIRQAAMFL
jgi:hypothetical protein